MDTLFPIEPLFPPGFSYFEEFISGEEEAQLCKIIAGLDLNTFLFRGYEAKRKVASYGYDYHFDTRSVSKGNPIPHEFNFLLERLAKHLNISSSDFTEVLVTEYPVGSVINWHRDAPPFDFIAGISLQSDCKFRLRPYNKSKQVKGATLSFQVKRRSLYIMKDESRDAWEHSIDKVKEVRYSITLRTLR